MKVGTSEGRKGGRAKTLWAGDGSLDRPMLDFTVGSDRETDGVLLPWDVLGISPRLSPNTS